jgi:leader peptidase (prepilin peptidase)/N-methyltransferase
MISLFIIFIFLLGIAIGSFLNVVALRYNTGRSINGRSFCFSCGKKLHWYELIPVLSFIAQRGKCRKCGAKLSWQYPLIEVLTGLLFVGLFLKLLPDAISNNNPNVLFLFVYHAVIWSILIVILIYDFRHKIIPDGLVYTFIILSLAGVFFHFSYSNLIAGPVLFLPFFLLWFCSQGRWMGFGDAKFALGIGWYLGLMPGTSAVILAFWVGAVVAVSILVVGKVALSLKRKQLTMKSEIPFAPFLIIGMAIVFFLGISILDLGLFFI